MIKVNKVSLLGEQGMNSPGRVTSREGWRTLQYLGVLSFDAILSMVKCTPWKYFYTQTLRLGIKDYLILMQSNITQREKDMSIEYFVCSLLPYIKITLLIVRYHINISQRIFALIFRLWSACFFMKHNSPGSVIENIMNSFPQILLKTNWNFITKDMTAH